LYSVLNVTLRKICKTYNLIIHFDQTISVEYLFGVGSLSIRHASYFDEKLEDYRKKLVHSLTVVEKTYELKTKVKNGLLEHNINSEDLEVFVGNRLQQRLHEKILQNFDRSFSIPHSELKTLSIGSLKCAFTTKRTRKYALSEACISLSNSLLYFAERAGTGFLKGGYGCRNQWRNLHKNCG